MHPEWRGLGIGTAGTATVAAVIVGSGRIASLYVNNFNTVARAAYAHVGFADWNTLSARRSIAPTAAAMACSCPT